MRLSTTLCFFLGVAHSVYAIPASIASLEKRDESGIITTGKPSLLQSLTNGLSKLGTKDAPQYSIYTDQPAWGQRVVGDQCPWGEKTVSNTNVYTDTPNTGVVRSYDWTIERGVLAPDGVSRSVILVNGAFPGPAIEADWGDTIQVTVHNNITGPEEGTAIHFHGLLQKGTQFMDGVPGVTQCPIAPGQTFTYTFTADLYGTSWWHAHYSAQYTAGIYGPMIIHGPVQDEVEYDTDLGPVLLSDYYHEDYLTLVEGVMGTDPDLKKLAPASDNNLINGKGNFDCNSLLASGNATSNPSCTANAGLSKFYFKSGQTYRLRLINAGADGLQKFSIDGHDLTVIAQDFVPVQPYTTKVATLGIGQRTDIIVQANQNSNGAFFMRSTIPAKCGFSNQPIGLAMVYYEDADDNSVPTSTSDVQIAPDACTNDDLAQTVPYFPIAPPSVPDAIQTVDVNYTTNATQHHVWTVNNSTFRANFNQPILHSINQGVNTSTFPTEWNVYDFGSASSIRFVINNLSRAPHPMHIHGHNMYVLSSTSNQVADPVTINPSNPARRDVHILPPLGQIVLQIDADNPGVWPLHCHIAWHVSGGLYMNIVEQPDVLKDLQLPQANMDMCTQWNAFTAGTTVDQVDSGLKVRTRQRIRRAAAPRVQVSALK